MNEAKVLLKKARTVEELRQAQAVILPLELGFSMEQVAEIIGVSRGWACQIRMQFIRSGGANVSEKRQRGGRHRENMSMEEEKAFLAPFLTRAWCKKSFCTRKLPVFNDLLSVKTTLSPLSPLSLCCKSLVNSFRCLQTFCRDTL